VKGIKEVRNVTVAAEAVAGMIKRGDLTMRLMTLRQIQKEKFPRSRSWIFASIKVGDFPKPIGGCVPNLWIESVIDQWLNDFVVRMKENPIGHERIETARRAIARKKGGA